MKAIMNNALLPQGAGLELIDAHMPTLKRGEVLIKVHLSCLSQADLLLVEGRYYFQRPAPFVPGLMGVGEVVEHRAGLLGRLLVGRRVFFSPGYERGGAWSEYAIADAMSALPLRGLSEEAALGMGNAMTALGLVDTAAATKSQAILVNAAAGSLGGLIARAAQRAGLTFVGIVRSERQVAQLREAGVAHVLNQSEPEFLSRLESLSESLGARMLVDSLGGGASVEMMKAMPKGSTALVIGHLSQEPISFDGLPLLLGRGLTLRAFGVSEWLEARTLASRLRVAMSAQALLRAEQAPRVQRRVSMQELVPSFFSYTRGTSEGMTIIEPAK